jgi:hypothetical protein
VPAISPASVGAATYTITGSKGAVADLSLAFSGTGDTKDFEIRYPHGLAGAAVTLVKGVATLALLPGPIVNHTATFAGRQINASVTQVGSDDVLSGTITVVSGGAVTDAWTLRLGATAATTWQVIQGENDPAFPTIVRVMCDPVASFTIAPSPVKEGQTVTLTADLGTGTGAAPTVVKAPAAPSPQVRYNWTYSGTIAVPAFPDCNGQVKSFTAPFVYGPTTMNLGLQVWFDGGCPSPVGDLTTTSPTQALSVQSRTHHLAVVLDRSGSMTGQRWDNAKTAGRMLAHLFGVLRGNVNPADRMTEIVFEDNACTFHAAPMSGLIAPVLPLSGTAAAEAAICATAFGPAGSCTPIGDGLIKAMDNLATLGVTDDPRFTVVLLTDGYENAGTVNINPSTPVPAGVSTFTTARTTGTDRAAVNARMSLFAVGLGGSVDEQALDALALSGAAGIYRHITDVGALQAALTSMVAFAAGAEQPQIDPLDPANQARTISTEPKVSRLAIAVEWPSGTLSPLLQLERFNPGTSAWDTVAFPPRYCETHGVIGVNIAALEGGSDNVPAIDWRVTHTVNGTATQIQDGDILAFVDLFVRAELSFDKEQYKSGDTMILTIRIRAGDQPVTDAHIVAELARPGESLGTFLAKHGTEYKPAQPSGPDPLSPKAAMIAQLLQQQEMEQLPILTPQGIFADGTDELFDDGAHEDGDKDDGDYANRFTNVDADGTYTWRFAVDGKLADGSTFTRLITVSKWVGVHVDPASSPVTGALLGSGDGLTQTLVSVRPASATGLFLGPFQAADVVIAADGCRFEPQPLGQAANGIVYKARNGGTITSHYDGTYSRMLVCKDGESATVSVVVGDEKLTPVQVGKRGSSWDWLWQLILRFIKWLRKLLGI